MVNLQKGGKVSLEKVASDEGIATITKVFAGLGWDVNKYDGGHDFDLDASVFMCDDMGKVTMDKDFIFYGNKTAPGVTHMGDNKTGSGDGDDEVIKFDLTQVPARITQMFITVTIYEADVRRQNFGQVSNSYIHITDEVSGKELIRFDLGEDDNLCTNTAVVVAKLYRYNCGWKFEAIGSGYNGGLAALCADYGIDVEK